MPKPYCFLFIAGCLLFYFVPANESEGRSTVLNQPVSCLSLQKFDVVIDEIFSDPSPSVGLPNAEFIEIKNLSGRTINLQGWKLVAGNNSSSAFSAYNLPPDSFLILSSTGNASLFSGFGKTLGVGSFPSLDNDGEVVSLISKDGAVVHAVAYEKDWYENPVKEDGGWSLEMIDTKNPCAGKNNWKASVDPKGGTPGKKNSVDALNKDEQPPALLRSFSTDNSTVILVFDEPLDSASAASAGNYSLDNNMEVESVKPLPPLYSSVQIKLKAPLATGIVYQLTAKNISDCKGNSIASRNTTKVGLAEPALSGTLVINEILFDPEPNAEDYVEIYNKSNSILDASQLFLANRNSTGSVASIKKIAAAPFHLFPGDYIVITEDKSSLAQNYFVKNPDVVFELSSLPSFPDDKGTVVLLNEQGTVIDEVSYKKDWHFALLANAEGISLERIDPNGPSADKNNWHSAASTAGFGTPGYQNSQYKQEQIVQGTIDITPKIFSPDNDGFDDLATIHYQMEQPGFVANISIFNASGNLVRRLVKNELLGLNGKWYWDGLNEKQQRLPVGIYVIYSEIFNLRGKQKQLKTTVVLARKQY